MPIFLSELAQMDDVFGFLIGPNLRISTFNRRSDRVTEAFQALE